MRINIKEAVREYFEALEAEDVEGIGFFESAVAIYY